TGTSKAGIVGDWSLLIEMAWVTLAIGLVEVVVEAGNAAKQALVLVQSHGFSLHGEGQATGVNETATDLDFHAAEIAIVHVDSSFHKDALAATRFRATINGVMPAVAVRQHDGNTLRFSGAIAIERAVVRNNGYATDITHQLWDVNLAGLQ